MRFVIFLAGAAMAASYVVTWFEPPFAGQHLSPHQVIGDDLARIVQEGPWQAWVFLGGFALAAISAVVALLGRASGLLSLLAGLSPIVLIVYYYSRLEEFQANIGLPIEVDFSDMQSAYDLIGDMLRSGLYLYFGGAFILLVAGLAVSAGNR
ncbi:hypothetical protein V8J82_00700 [Gymnodinialimonas sp. 2305UL16-5]|uniref:hypothetical protein n=1 Tax=Gymnodinialimonas mytili TaxID=3126503 RepID=UPI0030B5EE4D